MAHGLRGRFGMWFAMWGQFAKRGSSFNATLSKLCSLSSLQNHKCYWTRIPIGLCQLKMTSIRGCHKQCRLLANNFLQKLLPLAQLYYANRKSGLIVTSNNFKWSIWSIFIHTALTVEVLRQSDYNFGVEIFWVKSYTLALGLTAKRFWG